MNKEKLGSIGLFLTSIIWGYTFVAIKVLLYTLHPFFIVGFRNILAGSILFLIFIKYTKDIKIKDIIYSTPVALALFGGFSLQTLGSQTMTASKVAFITGAYMIFIPFITWILYKKAPHILTFVSTFIALVGIYLLSSFKGFDSINIGDIYLILSSLSLAIHLVLIDRTLIKVNGIKLTVLQLLISGVVSLIFALTTSAYINIDSISSKSIFSFLYLALFGSAIAYLLQTVSQKYVAPTKTSIILSLESLMGAIMGIIFLKEDININLVIGGSLIIIAIFVCELENIRKHNKKE